MDEERKTFADELHHRVVRKFKRRSVIVHRLDEIWAIDLASMETIASHNDGYKFILCIVDVFSKYAFCVPLKNKSAPTVLNALKDVVAKSDRIPEKIWVDRGTEFYNKDFLSWAKTNDITVYSTYGDSKSVIVERFIRTLRDILTKKFTETQSYEWVKLLPSAVNYYNNKFHKTIQMSPKEASDPNNSLEVFLRYQSQAGKDKKSKKVVKFKVGDDVRVSRIKGKFEKGSDSNWSHEVFKINEVRDTDPVTYKLIDYNKDPIDGSFYSEELLKTKVPDYFLVEKILDSRKVGKKKQVYVKFKGYSDKFNMWLDEGQVTDIAK